MKQANLFHHCNFFSTGSRQGTAIANQLMDVCIRVSAIRSFAVNDLAQLLEQHAHAPQLSPAITEVLYAAAYLVGEFANELERPLDALTNMLAFQSLPPHIQAVFIQNILKLFARLVKECEERQDIDGISQLHDMITIQLGEYVKSAELEVQERANTSMIIVSLVHQEIKKSKYFFILLTSLSIYTSWRFKVTRPKYLIKVLRKFHLKT